MVIVYESALELGSVNVGPQYQNLKQNTAMKYAVESSLKSDL